MLLLEMKCKELHIIRQEPLATDTGGLALWGRGGGGKARSWNSMSCFWRISKHESADELWMMVNKVARTKTRLKRKLVEYRIHYFR